MKAKTFIFYLLAILLGGCLPVMSLHPLYFDSPYGQVLPTSRELWWASSGWKIGQDKPLPSATAPAISEKNVVFDEKLLGTWVDDPNSPKITWEFKRADANENAYRLIFSDDEGGKGLFVAHLVKLKDKLFLDVHLGEPPLLVEVKDPNVMMDPNKFDVWKYNTLFLIPAHTFIRVNSVEPQLKMQLTDHDEMKEFLKADPNAVKHEFLEDGSPILTGSTKELQAFVLKYADDKRVFGDEGVLNRKKTAEPNAPPVLKPKKPKM